MRTSAVLAGFFGGNTKVVSARLNSAAMACICPPESPLALRTTPSGLPANWVPVKTSTVTKFNFMGGSQSTGRYVIPREWACANRHCRRAYDRALTTAMNKDFDQLAARAAPAIFVVLWSTGFVATKCVLRSAEPLTYIAIRMAIVVAIMAAIVVVVRPRWPNWMGIVHSVVAGLLVHGFYLGGTAVAISLSIPAGLSALIPGLQPILTSTIANRWLGERVTPLQWMGLLLGLAGVALILHERPMNGEA